MSELTSPRNELHYVLFKEEDAWIAMCLEHYIGSQGRTREEAMTALRCAYRAELDYTMEHCGGPFYGIMRAPEKFHDMWTSKRTDVERGTIHDTLRPLSEDIEERIISDYIPVSS